MYKLSQEFVYNLDGISDDFRSTLSRKPNESESRSGSSSEDEETTRFRARRSSPIIEEKNYTRQGRPEHCVIGRTQ